MYTLEEIEDMLDALPMDEFRFDKVGEDTLTYVGAIRTTEGQNIIEPSTESASMIIGLKPSIDFLTASPQIVRQLLGQLKGADFGEVIPAPEDEPAEPDNPATAPFSVPAAPKPRKTA